jgi:glycosyltransferase involved in cell wall biosynthesis
MATYNRAHFILETLLSIQAQSFLNWECLIIDDGGSDNTKEVISPIVNQDARFQYLQRSDNYKKGLPGCRNYGLDIAKGEFIIFFDDDDLVHPNNLMMSLEVFENNNIDFCHYQKMSFEVEPPQIVDSSISIDKFLSKVDIYKIITQEIGLASCTVLWNRQCFDVIRFNDSLMYAEEWECYTRIILENFKGIIINNVLYYNRKHPDSNTGEFYRYNPLRRESKSKAILLVLQYLKEKKMVSNSLKRYFVTFARDFSEYNLFNNILNILDLNRFEKMKWHLFYMSYPMRLSIYKIKKHYKISKQ